MKPVVKLLSVALLFSFAAMTPLVAADRFAPINVAALDAMPAVASGLGFSHAVADAGLRRHAFEAGAADNFYADPAAGAETVQAIQAPQHRAWMTLVAGVGLIAMLLGRIKRRYS